MVSGSSFGVATCNTRRAPRYHAHDYDDDGYSVSASEDPMVWSGDQWRSDLFGGYRNDYDDGYDRRFRPAPRTRAIVVHEVLSVDVAGPAAEALSHGFKVGVAGPSGVNWTVYKTAPRANDSGAHGMRIWRGGAVCDTCRSGAVVRPATRCAEGGSLIITWTEGGAEYRCATPRRSGAGRSSAATTHS